MATQVAPPRSVQLTQVTEWSDGQFRLQDDVLAAEEPLEIRIGQSPLTVTMRTPGHDEELAAGFLLTEGILEDPAQLASLRSYVTSASGKHNGIEVELRDCQFDPAQMQRNFFAASSCGICGKASIEAIRQRGLHAPNPDFRFDPELLCTLPDKLRAAQAVFSHTGGLHAAGLFSASGELLVLREDIGRHNAVDKVVGWAMLQGKLPLSQHILLVSGRGGFEIIQKALAAGIPALASVSAPSSLAVQLARELGLTLIGFLRGRRFVLYSGAFRCAETRISPGHNAGP
ncbi:formate dehydrogenase accessory sulfurtransferase FdhD [Acidicapsa ligni]|uniref:formate dehydrogenase accessory sulfurtransferase FdhD n=1 Tax=Acidicapsa ligni TaxID=542300 RepID=UPI0021DF4AB2|nr:formate dehydrogenase accessory sulfurtransferase FdhD [Acidicapsa ligni]